MLPWNAMLAIFAWAILFLTAPAQGADVLLQWSANSESNIFGYRIYYHPGPSAPPYQGTDALEGVSPIQVEANDITEDDICTFQISGLKNNQTYYFVVTANDEIEGVSGAQGGGGGCFIGRLWQS
jgi:hypothetical protein